MHISTRAVPHTHCACGGLGYDAVAFPRFAVGQEFVASRAVAREASEGWWAVKVSNLRPSACKADALPAELTAHPGATIACEMYPRIAPQRKRVATLLLRPDHTGPQTPALNSNERP